MFFGWPSTKIAKMVLLGWTKWLSELRIEKTLDNISSSAHGLFFKMISQKCSLDDLLREL